MSISYWRRRNNYYKLLGSKCRSCGEEFYPPLYNCRKCRSSEIYDYSMPKEGKIISFTVLREPMSSFKNQQPMILGIIKLKNGVKILSQIVDESENNLQTGDSVKLVFRKINVDECSDQVHYGYKFVKIRV